jgi:hypothetical protein
VSETSKHKGVDEGRGRNNMSAARRGEDGHINTLISLLMTCEYYRFSPVSFRNSLIAHKLIVMPINRNRRCLIVPSPWLSSPSFAFEDEVW